MKTLKILMLAALTVLPPTVSAEVNLYGEIKTGVEAGRFKSGGRSVSGSGVYDSGSYIGLRGSHAIGGGNSVIWQSEQNAPATSRTLSRTVWQSPSVRSDNDGAGQGGFGR